MKKLSRRLTRYAAAIAVGAALTPMTANAYVVRFEGTFAIRNSTDGFVFCPVGSPCAQAFESDTGIAPVVGEFAQGLLKFAYDTSDGTIQSGSSVVLSSFFDPDTPTYAVTVSSESAGGTFLTACYGGVRLGFTGTSVSGGGTSINGHVNYCLPSAIPGAFYSLNDFVSAPTNTFGGAAYRDGISGGPWALSGNGIVLTRIPEPTTIALVGISLAGVGLSRRKH